MNILANQMSGLFGWQTFVTHRMPAMCWPAPSLPPAASVATPKT
jgi:hypothetical protein